MTEVVLRAASALVDGVLQPADVAVAGGRIERVILGTGTTWPDSVRLGLLPADRVLLPGNVDTHVHVNEPGRTAWEGFASATAAAALGGITTIVDMPLNSVPATVDPAALELKRAVAQPQVQVDVAFWGGAVPGNLGSLRALWDEGVLGFKCFLVDSGVPEFGPLDAAEFARAMAEVASFDGLMLVHAEDPDIIASSARWSSAAYTDFVTSRPDAAEVRAIQTVIEQIREHGTRTHLLHLSSARALELIGEARAEGLPLSVETCPHYLVFDSSGIPEGGVEFKCCPPIRDAGNQEALWQALADGLIDCVVSDHSPSTESEKRRGGADLSAAWGGIAGLQVSFPVMADAARTRGFDLASVSRWMAAEPARIAGLAAKGAIEAGRDADLVIYDPDATDTVTVDALAHRNKISAYDGRELRGRVCETLLRGSAVGRAGSGELLRRGADR